MLDLEIFKRNNRTYLRNAGNATLPATVNPSVFELDAAKLIVEVERLRTAIVVHKLAWGNTYYNEINSCANESLWEALV